MTVYVVQKQMRMDHRTGELIPRFPLIERAEAWGDLFYLLSSSANPFKSEKLIKDLHRDLSNFSSEDYLVLTGNPVLIGLVTSVAAHYSDNVNFLQWSRKKDQYAEVKTRII